MTSKGERPEKYKRSASFCMHASLACDENVVKISEAYSLGLQKLSIMLTIQFKR